MTSSSSFDEDDFLSSLGTSLMKDLLSEMSDNPNNNNNNNSTFSNNNNDNKDIFQTLHSLEKELDTGIGAGTNIGTPSALPPPGLSKPSAAAMIVDHAATSALLSPPPQSHPATTPSTNNATSTEDAWSQALSQFSALSLTDDFLQADSARKVQGTTTNNTPAKDANDNETQKQEQSKVDLSNQFVDSLFDDYDEDGKTSGIRGGTGIAGDDEKKAMMGLFPGLSIQSALMEDSNNTTDTAASTNTTTATPSKQNQNALPSVTIGTPTPLTGLPPHMQQHQHQLPPHFGSSPPPHMMMGGPPGHAPQQPPPHMMMRGPPPPHMMGGRGHPLPPHMMGGRGHMMPPHMMGGRGHMMPPPPPHMMGGMGVPPPPHMMGGVPPPGAMPHPAMMMHHQQMQMMQQQQMHHHQQQQQEKQEKQEEKKPEEESSEKKNKNSSAKIVTLKKEKESTESKPQIFKKLDFPALGADPKEIDQERKEEEAKLKEIKKKKKEKMEALAAATKAKKANNTESSGDNGNGNGNRASSTPSRNKPSAAPTVRLTFQDPSPNAPPISATSIPSKSMTSRDLCHVLHSIMRPLLTFENVLDAYNADYYHWSYNDRKSRNLLFNNNISGNINLPNPVWKETKIKAQAMESKFRSTVEKRADEWSKEKQALGKMAKANVKRPRALLATTALSSTAESRVTSGLELDNEMDDYKLRALLWAARVGIDKGYLAYLNLVELRRLLQSRPGDALSNVNEVENRRGELLHDVEENVGKLHSAFGVGKEESGKVTINGKVLSRTLSLPKGRMLLSRVVDEGILPHPSACHLLPFAIKVILESASTQDLAAAPPAGEDRLLRSLTGLVRTVQPSVDVDNFLACLASTIDAKTVMDEKKKSLKVVLAGKRTLMELLHAIFTRGGEVCVGEHESEWKAKESAFLMILSGGV